MIRILICLCAVFSLAAQTTTLSDSIVSAVGGQPWAGRVTVSLSSPGSAQPLYSGTTSLAGWSTTVCLGVVGPDCDTTTTAGTFSLTLWTNSSITPGGTSYVANFQSDSLVGLQRPRWTERWIVAPGNTKLYQIRSTVTPTPNLVISLNQIAAGGAVTNQVLQYNGSAWAPATLSALVDPTTTTGDILYRSAGGLARLGIGSTGQVLTVASGLPSWAAAAGGGAVSSVFGRTGAVVAATNDYTAAQVTNAVDSASSYSNPAWLTALAWSKLTGVPSTFAPAAHASAHQNGGSDEIATATPGANAIPKAGGAGTLATGWIPTLTDAHIPNNITVDLATAAAALATPRTIAGVSFDGSANIAIPSTGLSDSANLVRSNAANTWSTGAQDFGAVTSLRMRVAAGLTATTDGVFGYDSTAGMLKAAQSGADAYVAQFTITPGNGHCVQWVVSGSQFKLGSTGSACGSGGGAAWGGITGTLSSQADLQAALDAKQPLDADLTALAGISGVRGDLFARGASAWDRLAIGLSARVLKSDGTDPSWGQVAFSELSGSAADSQIPNNITVDLAAAATSLAANGGNCSGNLPRGVDASGAAEGCADVDLTTEVTGVLPNGNTTAASTNTASAIVARDGSGNFAAGTITAALAGNASTATALAANPPDCSSNQFATSIAANGDLTCAALVTADLPTRTFVSSMMNATLMPDTTGLAYFKPFSIDASLDLYPANVVSFDGGSTDSMIFGNFTIPQNFVSGAKACVVWTSTATSGNVRWKFGYNSLGTDDATSLDFTSDEETALEVNDAAPTAAFRRLRVCHTLTDANIAAGDTMTWRNIREASDTGNDTLAAAALLFAVEFEYQGR